MKDDACISFLQWALPYLHMRWSGFRKVRGQVCKRLARRLDELQQRDLKSYSKHLQDNPLEWHILDSLCRITISRFYRDQGIYDALDSQVFPKLIALARRQNDKILSSWSIGSASGEEPYSLSILWELSGSKRHGTDLRILATEVEQSMINRARLACYPASSVRELPATMKNRALDRRDDLFCLKERFKKRVEFLQQDIRYGQPDATFHLILCRNLVFTYYSLELQKEIAQQIVKRLKPGGCLVIGTHENLPGSLPGMVPWLPGGKISRKTG